MDQTMINKIKALGDRQRIHHDPSKTTTNSNMVRWQCMEATMKLFRALKPISDQSTYEKINRAYFTMSSTAPLKVICVGISPYKNGILPHFASSLAYCPGLCEGSTPSVQVLSQAMAMYAIQLDNRFLSSRPHLDPGVFPTKDMYTARFAEMLRMSYICSESGVMFVNCSPVITKTNCEECLAMSLFSEWLANIVEIHARNGYKLTIISMGELPDETVSDALKSSHTMAENTRILRCKNPAQTSRLSVKRKRKENVIPDTYTKTERRVAKISDEHLEYDPITKFVWYEYPESVLSVNLPFGSLVSMVGLLAAQVPEELGDRFLNTITDIHKDFSTISKMDIEDENFYDEVAVEQTHSETDPDSVHVQDDVLDDEDEDPFTPIPIRNKGKGYDRERTVEPEERQKKSGPFGVTKHSQFAQLVDPTGKGVSQQSIVIDNIRKSAADMLTMWKQTVIQVGSLNKQVQTHLSVHRTKGLFNESNVLQCQEIMVEYENQMRSLIEKMEMACAHVEGLPAAVEGDYGIYTKETQPTAPLMRRENGATMKNGVYDVVFGLAKDNATTSKGIISVDEDENTERDEPKKETKKQNTRRAPSPAPSTVFSTTSTMNTVTDKEQSPMKAFVTEQICIAAAQEGLDEKVCLRMMKKKREVLQNRNGISTTVSFMKRVSKMGMEQETVKMVASRFLEAMDLQDESSVEKVLMTLQMIDTPERLAELWKTLNGE